LSFFVGDITMSSGLCPFDPLHQALGPNCKRGLFSNPAQVYFARIWQMNWRRDGNIRQMTVSR